jgi:soluble lytic murein transglycosylase-like protein
VVSLGADTRRAAAQRLAILEMVGDYRSRASAPSRRELADAIYRESVAAEVDPLLVASIVARESSFRSRAVSRVGAVGLMQLRPFVARNVAQRSSIEWNGMETLHSPDRNLRLGILYYKELLERFDGDHEIALTAYNYGPTRVSLQVARGTYRGSRYADRILDLYGSLSLQRAG